MKIGRIIVLTLIAILLCLSVVLAQVAFRLERTMLSYSYTSRQIDRIISPLYDPGIHEETVDGTFSFMRREFSLSVPVQLRSYILEAAEMGFSPEWFGRTAQRMLFNLQLVLNGKETTLSLPVSINSFKLAFMDIVRNEFETDEYLEIDREVSRMPSSFDLTDEMPRETLATLIKNLQRVRFFLAILQYLAPGILILLCFVFRRIGSSFAAAGSGLLGGGVIIAIATGTWKITASGSLGEAVRDALPSFLGWADYGIGQLADDLVSGMLSVALTVMTIGALLAALGFFLALAKGDPEMRMGGDQ